MGDLSMKTRIIFALAAGIALILCACALEEVHDTITVRFDSVGGAGISPVTLDRGESLGGRYPVPAQRDGLEFKGWYDGFTECTRNTGIYVDLTLVAHWENELLTVTFNSNGGVPDFAPIMVPKGSSLGVRFPVNPRRLGYTLENWLYDEGAVLGIDTPITAGITAAAQWKALTEYTVTFTVGDDAVPVDPIKVFAGDCIDEWEVRLPTPEYTGTVPPPATGRSFREWIYDPSGQNIIYTGRTPVTGNITLVAQWRYVIPVEEFEIDLSGSLAALPNHELLNYPLPTVEVNQDGDYVFTFTEKNSAIAIETSAEFRELMLVANSLTVEVEGTSSPDDRLFRLLIGDTITYAEGWNATRNLNPTLVPIAELARRDLVIEEGNIKSKPDIVNYVVIQTNRGLDNSGIEQETTLVLKSVKFTVR
jgi:hypothetical protein